MLRRNLLLAAAGGYRDITTPQIGGVPIGSGGDVGSIYEGYILSDGDEFTSLDLVSIANPTGAYFTTRAYRGDGVGTSPAPGRRAPATGALNVMHDVSPDYTGWNDQGRGTAQNYDSHSVSSSVLSLKAIRQTAGEQTNLATGVSGQIERGAMIHTAGRLVTNSPVIREARIRFNTGPAGQHPTFWNVPACPPGGDYSGNESGFEGSSTKQQAYHHPWASGEFSDSDGLDLGTTYRDGNFHTFTVKETATAFEWYVDGSLVHSRAYDPDTAGSNTNHYDLFTNHVYNAAFLGDSYSAAAWAADADGVTIEVDWYRVWRPSTGTHYTPLTTIADTSIAHGGTTTIVLPSQTDLWGATGLTEYVYAIPNEVEEPGGSNTASYNQFPTGITYDSGTRTVTVANTLTGAGVLHLGVQVVADGCTCKPARFRLYVAPRWVGVSSYSWVDGTPITDVDVYASWDAGRLFQNNSNPKGLSVSGLPAGLSFDSSTGLITGTPSGTSSGNLTIQCTNSNGQTTSRTQPYEVTSAVSGVPAPTLTGSPTLVASWDPHSAITLTTTGSNVDSISGADSTSLTLSSTGSNRPTTATVSGKTVLQFTRTSSQRLSVNSVPSGMTGGHTFVVIVEPVTVTNTACFFGIAAGSDGGTANRIEVLGSTSTGYQYRKLDNTGNNSVASTGSAYTTGIHLLIGHALNTNTQPAKFNIDGAGTAITAGVNSNFPNGNAWTVMGASRQSSSFALFADAYIYRVLVYQGDLNATQLEEIATWAATNYGTTNNA